MQFGTHRRDTKKIHEHIFHFFRKKHTNNYNKSLRGYIRNLLGGTKRCLEIVSIIGVVTEVSYISKIYYFLMWIKWLIIWGSFCLTRFKIFLHYSCYLPHSSLMTHSCSIHPPIQLTYHDSSYCCSSWTVG